MRVHLLVLIWQRTQKEYQKVSKTQSRENQVEVIQPTSIEIICQPTRTVSLLRNFIYKSDETTAKEEAASNSAQVNCSPQASHSLGGFIVEKLKLPNLSENLRTSTKEVLGY